MSRAWQTKTRTRHPTLHDLNGNRIAEYDFDPVTVTVTVTVTTTLLRKYIWMNGLLSIGVQFCPLCAEVWFGTIVLVAEVGRDQSAEASIIVAL